MPDAAKIIEEVYIDPIKSVLFIDDKFPTYADSINNSDTEDVILDEVTLRHQDEEQYEDLFADETKNTATEKDDPILPDVRRALNLTKSCRERGYIFDVENSAETALKYEEESSFINKADLVILDFILDYHADSSQDALSVIKRLNETKRFNLVVVYTNNEPIDVAHEIAYFLRGRGEPASLSKKARRRIGEFPDEYLLASLNDYLSGAIFSPLDWYNTMGLKGQPNKYDIINLFENHLNKRFPHIPAQPNSLLRCCGASENKSPWICGNAVFIAVVKKQDTEETITSLLNIMTECLASYVPSPISMLIHKSINTLKEGGTLLLEKAFGDEETRAALLYRALKSDFPATEDGRKTELSLADLMLKAFSILSSGVQYETVEFGKKLLNDCRKKCKDGNYYTLALKMEKTIAKLGNERLFLNMNAFLCSQPVDTGHITTGTVFRRRDATSQVWICVTPACDMVPARSRSGYRGKIAPANYFEALKVEKVSAPESVLQFAEQANHMFLKIAGEIQVFSVCSEPNKEPKPYVFYTQNGGYVGENNSMALHSIEMDDLGSFTIKEHQFEIIGQLRPEYASRYLAITGDWNSRIGVDFINYPER